MYIPLETTDMKDIEVREGNDSVQLSVSWNHHSDSSGYIVAIGDERCTTPNRNPPCVLVQNTVSFL